LTQLLKFVNGLSGTTQKGVHKHAILFYPGVVPFFIKAKSQPLLAGSLLIF